jgi:DNA-binding MarR family transcriptional regulator
MAGSASPATDVRQVADRLHSAALHLLRAVRRVDAELGVGPAQLSALSVLALGGPCSIGALARAEGVRLPTMSRLVAALQRGGLATRTSDPHDRRAVIVRTTARGRSVLRRGRERRVDALARRLEVLPTADRALLLQTAELIDRIATMRRPTSG